MRSPRAATLGLIVALTAAACGGGGGEETAAPTATAAPPTAAPTATETPEPTPTPVPGFRLGDIDLDTYPLTGIAIDDPDQAALPAVAVKMDNVAEALPQAGVTQADVIVEELVEGGLTRLVPVFHSQYPERIGPVRSGRSSDPDILAAFNTPLFAWWGAMDVVKGEIAQAEADGKLIDVGIDRYPDEYFRVARPVAIEHTGYTSPADLAALVPDAEAPNPIFGWLERDEELPEDLGEPVAGMRFGWGQMLGVFVWSEADEAWLHWEWGIPHTDEEGRQVAPRNVVALEVEYGVSAARPDSPQAITVGSGVARVFIDGRMITGTWEREEADGPWLLFDENGDQIRLRRGQTYIALFPGEPEELPQRRAEELLAELDDATAGDESEG